MATRAKSASHRERLPFFASVPGVALIVGLWGLSHLLLRASLSPVLGTDDMFENVFVQVLQAGYQLRQPPLYEWLLWSVQQFTGPTIWSFLIVKYGALTLAAVFLLLTARRVIVAPALAAIAVFSYSLFYQIGWNLHEGVTHTAILVAACSMTAWAFLRVLEIGRMVDYGLLGLAFGLGMLSKHSYPLFPLAFFIAILIAPNLRKKLRLGGLLFSLLTLFLVYAPFLIWILTRDSSLAQATGAILVEGSSQPHWSRTLTGLSRLLWSLIGFSAPLIPLVVLIFFPQIRQNPAADSRAWSIDGLERAELRSLLGRTVLIMIVLAAIGIIASGATYVKERHMHPLLLLAPVWLFARIERARISPVRLRLFVVLVCIVAATAFLARVPGLLAPDRIMCGGQCRHMKPYEDLAEGLSFIDPSQVTFVASDPYTGGNLRVLFPDARIVMDNWRTNTASRPYCYAVWERGETLADGTPARGSLKTFEEAMEDGNWPGTMVENARPIGEELIVSGQWRHLWKPNGFRVTQWGVRPLAADNLLCQ